MPPTPPPLVSSRTPLAWTVGWTRDPALAPARFVPARVPGAVQLDWARAENWPPHWKHENARAYAWMEDCHWLYRTILPATKPAPDEQLILVAEGVDYACEVRLDGRVLHRQTGMFIPFEIDLGDAHEGQTLDILVFPAPKTALRPDEEPLGRKEARQSTKPAVSYGWDFHPRLVPLGIWRDVHLQTLPRARRLGEVEVRYVLSDDLAHAELTLLAHPSAGHVRWQIDDPAGQHIVLLEGEASKLHATLSPPLLWWPRTEGAQPLYTNTVTLLDDTGRAREQVRQRFGIRRLRLIMGPGQFDEDGGLPATQPPVPITFEVNHRAIFARGANWVCPDIFPGTLTRERFREQLELVAAAHLNLVRCWGGAIANPPDFFDLCDELGLLVWQEFPLACNAYAGTPDYLALLRAEATAIIRRCRRHPSLALWCGGNELFNSWSGMTMQDPALRLLGALCYEHDPARPFLPTSPLAGIRHGDYRFRMGNTPDAPTVFEVYPALSARAYMEFGVPGPASVETLREIIPAAELWPPRDTDSWRFHHAYGAWCDREPRSWLYPETADHYFGPSASLEELVARLQLLQAEGYKAIYEEGRRQKPVCAALACWVFNEPWPTAANNSLVSWPLRPKPAYHAVAAACRPTLASARIPRFVWTPGEAFSVQLFLLHDGPASVGALEIVATLAAGSATYVPSELGRWSCPGTPANIHAAGPVLTGTVPARIGETFRFHLRVTGHPDLDSTYTLAFARA